MNSFKFTVSGGKALKKKKKKKKFIRLIFAEKLLTELCQVAKKGLYDLVSFNCPVIASWFPSCIENFFSSFELKRIFHQKEKKLDFEPEDD